VTLKFILNRLVRVVLEEAERNPAFEAELSEVLNLGPSKRKASRDNIGVSVLGDSKRAKNRRPPAVLDPLQVVREGEPALRSALEKLTLDQLRDIVADYGMDPGRVVMKWTSPERVVDRIVEMSVGRARKGDAFRKPSEEAPATETLLPSATLKEDDGN